MQLAHPLVAAGVHEHSSFRDSPWQAIRRLQATVGAMLRLTFGSAEEYDRTLDAILAIHRRVRGQLREGVGAFPAGTPYSAEDPALVLWVHVTLLQSIPLVYERLVAPLAEPERDAYCAEAAPLAVALGAIPAEVPRTWRAVDGSVDRAIAAGTLTIGPHARELASHVLRPPAGIWPAGWAHRLLAIGLLPPALRAAYGFEWTAAQQRQLDALVTVVRTIRRRTPAAVALWPGARQRVPTGAPRL